MIKVSPKLLLFFILFARSVLFSQQVAVEGIDFKGNEEVSSGRLRKAIKTQANPWYDSILFWMKPKIFDEDMLRSDLLRLEAYYHQEGYLDALVKDYDLNYNKDRTGVEIVVHLQEGKPTMVSEVEFLPGNSVAVPLEKPALLKVVKLESEERYREEDLRADYNALIQKFSNLGYPYLTARVKPVVDDSSHTARLEWSFDPGPLSFFGEVSISGNESVSDNVIRRGLEFKPGGRFEQSDLERSQEQIYRLQLFEYVSVRATNLSQKPDTIPIAIQVKETNIRTIKLGVGYGSEEAFRASANWVHRNFLGGARILRAELRHASAIMPINAQVEFSQPFLFDNQNDLAVKPYLLWQDEKSFEAKRLGAEATFNRQLDKITNAYLNVRIERADVDARAAVISEDLSQVYNKANLQIGGRWNATNQIFSPTKGYMARLLAEEAGLLFQSQFRYYKFLGEYRSYHQLAEGFVFAWRTQAGTMNPYRGSTTTPVEERFYSGGSYSVRGWERQQLGPQVFDPATQELIPIGGNSQIEGSFELRYPVFKDLTGAAFVDYGNVWPEWNGFAFTDVKYAAGIGLRYTTPIGPIRVDLAYKLNKQTPEENDFQLHLSIGQAF